MGIPAILAREAELVTRLLDRLLATPGIQVLDSGHRKRLAVLSFIAQGMHYNEVVKMLNDRFGIQARGGCSCAGTYGHHLLHIDPQQSENIRKAILRAGPDVKPGWVRLSLHPTMTNPEIDFIADAVAEVAEWAKMKRPAPPTISA
jgi:selenocysteine lyase/cysteine desulfurase